jgi:DNA-binding FadR family transcriptional regulator
MSSKRFDRVEGLREPQRLAPQLSTLLAAEIVAGRIGVGDAFPSSEEIVTRFGVSRTVAREMVQRLAMLGLVRIQHGKRTEVCPEEEWDILNFVVQEALRCEGKAGPLLHDLYEFRLLIEPQAAAWMAAYGKPGEIKELGVLASRMEELAAADLSVQSFMAADRSFHDLVARASGNRVLAAVSRDIREVIGTLWGLSTLTETDTSYVAEQHRAVAEAVARRDPHAASAAMHEHLVWASTTDLHGLGPQVKGRSASAAAVG